MAEFCGAVSRQGSVCEREYGHVGCHEQWVDGDSRRWWGDITCEVPGADPGACNNCGEWIKAGMIHNCEPRPTYWPGQNDHEEIGPIGDGTPHARMHWFWERMRPHEELIAELTGWSPVSSRGLFEAAIADAFDILAREHHDR